LGGGGDALSGVPSKDNGKGKGKDKRKSSGQECPLHTGRLSPQVYSGRSPWGASGLASRTSLTLAMSADKEKGLGRNHSPGSSTP
jgi:hypothetical protein